MAMAESARLLNPIPTPTSFATKPHRRRPSLSFPSSSSSAAAATIRCSSQTPNPNPNPSRNPPPLSCSAVAPLSSAAAEADVSTVRHRLRRLIAEFRSLPEPLDRVKRLLHYAATLPPFPDSDRTPANRVMGCTAQVWVSAALDRRRGVLRFAADSDSEITRGFCACIVSVLDGAAPEEVVEVRAEDFGDLSVVGPVGGKSRASTWQNVVVSMQKRARMLVAREEGRPTGEMFPSMVVGVGGVEAKGTYAEAQVSSKFRIFCCFLLLVV